MSGPGSRSAPRVRNPLTPPLQTFVFSGAHGQQRCTVTIRFVDRPIRRILPDFGGIDFSPLVVLILITILRMLLGGVMLDVASSYGA